MAAPEIEGTLTPPDSGSRSYPSRPIVGIGIIVLRPDAVLLVRRARPPGQGSWSLPGGAQKLGETAEAAARRELAEETGLKAGALLLAGCVDSIHPDEQGRIAYHYTILDFAARWEGDEARAGSDAAEIAWAEFERLGEFDLWSEAHRVIATARRLLA